MPITWSLFFIIHSTIVLLPPKQCGYIEFTQITQLKNDSIGRMAAFSSKHGHLLKYQDQKWQNLCSNIVPSGTNDGFDKKKAVLFVK